MAKTIKNKVSRIKVKKKIWCKIFAPELFGKKELGEAYLSSPEKAIGRAMKINLRDLTGNIKDQKVYARFLIDGTDGNNLKTSIIGYELTSTSIKRTVRKNMDRLDDYGIFTTKDGRKVIVKSLIITLFRTQRSVKKQIKEKFKISLKSEVSKSNFSTFISNIVNKKIQSVAKKDLTKIYPIKEVAIRVAVLKDRIATVEKVKVRVRELPKVSVSKESVQPVPIAEETA